MKTARALTLPSPLADLRFGGLFGFGVALVGLLGVSGCPDTSDRKALVDVDVDFENSCFANGCFDNDPCTEDRCLASGECLFVPNNPENACLTDFHCDTGTECVIGRCEVDGCGLNRCNFESVRDCRPCGPMFGSCFDGDACTPDVCDESTNQCEPRPAHLECESRCSSMNAVSVSDIQWMGPGFEGTFVGLLHVAQLACEAGCQCDVPLAIRDWDVLAPVLLDPNTERPMTCRLDTCGATPSVECGELVLNREVIVSGMTTRLGTPKDAPGAPAQDAAAPPRGDADAIVVRVICPSTRVLMGIDGVNGPWLATLEREGLSATFRLDPLDFSSTFTSSACDGCEALGLEVLSLRLTPEIDRVWADLNWSSGSAHAFLYPVAGALVAELLGVDGMSYGRLELVHTR